jgi:3D (Asp-Asp-Asp) domain-containing protein
MTQTPAAGEATLSEQPKMRTQISQARGSRALRRNRFIAGTVIALTITGLAAATFSFGVQPTPLLSLEELAVDRATPHAPAQGAALGQSPMPIAAPVVDVSNAAVAASNAAIQIDENIRWYNGRPVRPARTMIMTVTAYSPDARSCGEFADGITASGYSVLTNGGKLAAADTRVLPLGTMISVPGYADGDVIPVLDRGGAIKNNRLDLLYPTHDQALIWGVQKLEVTVWEYADGKPNDFVSLYDRKSSVNP